MTAHTPLFNGIKKFDRFLLFLPLFLNIFLLLLLTGVHIGISHFRQTLDDEIKSALAQKAGLTAEIVHDRLSRDEIKEAAAFCRNFDNRIFRLTLISPKGQVLADSAPELTLFDNHQDRPEFLAAQSGKPAFSKRYSGSLRSLMIYYALPEDTPEGRYVLRFAQPSHPYEQIVDKVSGAVIALMLISCFLLCLLQIYLVRRLYLPLDALGKTASDILHHRAEASIPVPQSGPVRNLAGIVSDMTALLRRQLKKVTEERNERRILFDTMSEAVLLTDTNGELIRSNRAAETLFEFPDKGKFNLARCQIPELLEYARQTFEDGQPFEHEFSLERSGTVRSLFIKGRLLEENGDKRLLLTVTELTSLRKLESFRSDFVANVSHEIKTPLTCIIGAVEALEDRPSEKQIPRLLNMLKKQSQRLNNLVHDILSLASLEKQQLNPEQNFVPVSLDSVLVNAVNLCAAHAENAGFTLLTGEHSPQQTCGDPSLLEQALVNLIENAVKYSGGKKITVSLRKEGSQAVFEVKDDGIGIPPEHRARIFERFYRVDKSRSRELGGTGLGLAIVKHIAQLHHGKAELADTPDSHGCTFRLLLPLNGPA